MDSIDVIIFRAIYFSVEPVEIYFFHNHYKFSPGQIAEFIDIYSNLNYITYSNNTLALTEAGHDFVLVNKIEILFGKRHQYWKNIPESFLLSDGTNSIEEYFPSLSFKDISSFVDYSKKWEE